MVRMRKEGLTIVFFSIGIMLLVSLGFSLVDDGSSSITGAIIGDSGPLFAQVTQDSCSTINGDTEINDTVLATGNCFVVNASHITINGQGKTVRGADTGTAFEIYNVTNVTIFDLTVKNFDYGFIINLSDSINITTLTSQDINSTVLYLGGASGGVHGNHSLSHSTFDGGVGEEIRLNTTWDSNFTNLTFTNQKIHLALGADSANNIIYNPSFSTSDPSFPAILDEDSGAFNDLIFEDLTAGRLYWQKSNFTITDQLGIGANIVIDAQGSDYTLGLESSDLLANLNSSATIDFYNQVFGTQPFVLKDGVRCDDTDSCNVTSYSGGNLAVDVSSFSNFTTQSSLTCGTYLNTNINLGENLYCNQTAFIVNATDITINGQGYAIYGNGSGYGVNVTNGNFGAVVENLTIANFSRAISVDGADGPALYNLNVSVGQNVNTTSVIFIKDSNTPQIHNNTINASGDNTFGIFIQNTESALIADNDLNSSGSSAHGIYLFDNSFSSTVSNNNLTVQGVGSNAMRFQTTSDEFTISRNVVNISGNSSQGIFADSASTSQITNNRFFVSGTNAAGINLSAGSSIVLSNTNLTGDSSFVDLIYLGTPITSATVQSNIFASSQENVTGLHLDNVGGSTGNNILDNVVMVLGSGSTAVLLQSGTNLSRFTNNNLSSRGSVIIDDSGLGNSNQFIINSSFAQINWTVDNLSTSVNITPDSTVFVQNNSAAFIAGTSQALALNTSALIELRNLTYDSTVYVLRDGERCDDTDTCNYTYVAATGSASNGTMYLNVSHFSNYSVTDTISSSSTPTTTTTADTGTGGGGGGGGGGSLPPSDTLETEVTIPSASSQDTASETEYTTAQAILENLEIGPFLSGTLSLPSGVEGEFRLIEGILLPSEVLVPQLLTAKNSAKQALIGQAVSTAESETSGSTSTAFTGTLSGVLSPSRNSFAQSGSTVNIYYLPLRNNGDKTIRLVSELHQEQLDTAYFIVTRKESTLLQQEAIPGVSLASQASDEELLEARILVDEIVLAPGEEQIVELRVSSGISREEDPTLALLNLLTTQREIVSSFDVQVENTPITLNAVALHPESHTLDFYSMIINSDQPVAQDTRYFVEASIEELRGEFSFFGPSVYFADLYGPYPLLAGDEYIFSQKFVYDPALYTGQMQLRMKTLIFGESILTDLFLLDFDAGIVSIVESSVSTLESDLQLQEELIVASKESLPSDSAITGNLIGRVQGRQDNVLTVIFMLVFIVFILVVFLCAPRIKRILSKTIVSRKATLSGQNDPEHLLVSHLEDSITETNQLRSPKLRGSQKFSTPSKQTLKVRSVAQNSSAKKAVRKTASSSSVKTRSSKKRQANSSQKHRKQRR